MNAILACGATGATSAERAADMPVGLALGAPARWRRGLACTGGGTDVSSEVACKRAAAGRIERTIAASLAARTDPRPAGAPGADARVEIAPAWSLPVTIPASASGVVVSSPNPAQRGCRVRLDQFPEVPLSERTAWPVDRPGVHLVTVRCEAMVASCSGGTSAWAVERTHGARVAVTVE